MSDIIKKIKKIKFNRLSIEEKLVHNLLENTKIVNYESTIFLVNPENDVLVELLNDDDLFISTLLRFNYDIMWIPLIHNRIDLIPGCFIYTYLSERFNINLNIIDVGTMGGVSVKFLPYDKY